MKRFFRYAVLSLVPLLAMPAAAETAEQIVNEEHPEFYSCKKDEECVVVKGLCDEWRVVNIANEKKLTDAINYLTMAVNCKEYATYRPKPGAGCTPDRLCQLSQ